MALLLATSWGCAASDDSILDESAGAANEIVAAGTVELLERLRDLRGLGVLAGQYNNPEAPDTFSANVKDRTGRPPAIWGGDFKYGWRVAHRSEMIDEAIRQWGNGSVITLMYHAPLPGDPIDGNWDSVGGELSRAEWDSLLTPGTELHTSWLGHLDAVAAGLKQLREAGVVVLWRPYHEMNATHFWWGQKPGDAHRSVWRQIYPHIPHLVDPITDLLKWLRGDSGRGLALESAGFGGGIELEGGLQPYEKDGFRTLWRLMYERFTAHHGLNNLLWVWSVSPPSDLVDPLEPYWPGDEYVDVVGLDLWTKDLDQEAYEEVRSIAAGRPIMLTEIGHLPDPDSLRALQPDWVAVMVYMHYIQNVPDERLVSFYSHPWVVTLDEWILEAGR